MLVTSPFTQRVTGNIGLSVMVCSFTEASVGNAGTLGVAYRASGRDIASASIGLKSFNQFVFTHLATAFDVVFFGQVIEFITRTLWQ